MKIAIVGNSAAGKSTLARGLAARHGLAHLDLDSVAWTPETERRPLEESARDLEDFFARESHWVVEGCYADLAEIALRAGAELIWLDPGQGQCLSHAESRPWEPHKYESPEAQEAKLPMLRDWIRGYATRTDGMSGPSHRALFESWPGQKRKLSSVADALAHAVHPRLIADTHRLGELGSGTLLLHRNASLPWFILVPDVGPHDVRELLDLDARRLESVMADARAVSEVLKERGHPKVNVASLGNQVPQLHVHLVGRTPGDACWPQPVWGNLPEGPAWTDAARHELTRQVAARIRLEPA